MPATSSAVRSSSVGKQPRDYQAASYDLNSIAKATGMLTGGRSLRRDASDPTDPKPAATKAKAKAPPPQDVLMRQAQETAVPEDIDDSPREHRGKDEDKDVKFMLLDVMGQMNKNRAGLTSRLGKLEEMKADVTTLKGQMTNVGTDIKNIKSDIVGQQIKYDELQQKFQELEAHVQALKAAER